MYIKNFEPEGKAAAKYAGLRRDSKFRFLYFMKFVAWFLVLVIAIFSSVLLVGFGLSYGVIKTYLWMTTLFFSVSVSAFISTPFRVFLLSIVNALFSKKAPYVIKKKINVSFLKNPDNPFRKEKVLKFRQYNAHLYAPTPLYKLENQLEDIKYNIELRNLAADIAAHLFFMAVVVYLILLNTSHLGFYNHQIVKNLVLEGNYTKTIPFSKVTTYEQFMEYLNETLLPALLMNITEYGNSSRRGKRWSQETDGHPSYSAEIRKRQILSDFTYLQQKNNNSQNQTDIFDKGWTLNSNLKLMGKPRLRQIRVKAGPCKQLKNLKTRNLECAPDLTLFNVERRKFSLRWEPGPPKGLTPKQASPWIYRSAGYSRTFPTFGKFSFYPGGGYILDLARNIKDARIILEFLNEFQWVDMRTRAVFIEFTVYCVNTNVFNIVTLIVEKTASGYIIPNYRIHTAKLMFLLVLMEVMFLMLSYLFGCLLFFFLLREAVKMYKTSLVPYLKRGFILLDVTVILLGLLSVSFISYRNYYISYLLKDLQKAENNAYVSFLSASIWHKLTIYTGAFLICVSSFKLLRLLSFRVIFFQMQTVLSFCRKHFFYLIIKQVVLILAFAFFFNLSLGSYAYGFNNFNVSFLTVILRTIALDDSFEFKVFTIAPWYLGLLFFGFFIFFVTILFVNIFIAVTCLYLREVQKVSLAHKYDILEYVRHALVKQVDILRPKEVEVDEKRTDPAVMRLKGGGNKPRKVAKKRKTGEKECKCRRTAKNDKKSFSMKIKPKGFVTERAYDTTKYQDLAVDRATGMKYMMLSLLSENKRMRNCARGKALKALFCSYTAEKKKAGMGTTSPGSYYFVVNKSTREVYDSEKFLKMKEIVKDTVRNKGLFEEEEKECEEITKAEDMLFILNQKLCLLLKKQNLK